MKKQQFQDLYPVLSIEINKENCIKNTIKDILNILKEKIDIHPTAKFIANFNHFSHTQKIKDNIISSEIIDAQMIIFCFGKKLESPLKLAIRPRSIGITETKDKFILCFLETPNLAMNNTMEKWIKFLIKK